MIYSKDDKTYHFYWYGFYNKKTKIDTTTLTINLAHLPRSQYLVQLQANNSIYYSKIIKL